MEALDRIGTELVAIILHGPDRRRAFSIVCRSVHLFLYGLVLADSLSVQKASKNGF